MKTAIILHLNYETQPVAACRQLWSTIEAGMLAAGFSKNGRIFVTDVESESAFELARDVMDRVEHAYQFKGDSTATYVRDFYGIPFEHIVDLAHPTVGAIEVDMLASGAFQKFFG